MPTDSDGLDVPPPPSGKIINRHRALKQAAKGGMSAASVGISAAQMGTGTGALALIAGATSATGIGLVVTGGVLTVASSILSGRSAYKTKKHIDGLKDIEANAASMSCTMVHDERLGSFASAQHHDIVVRHILPYILKKKRSKLYRKAASTIPGVSLLEGIRAIGKKGYKYAKGTLGANREAAATWLAHHFLTYDCEVSNAIVAELYGSEDEMIWLREQDAEVVVALLMEKMKST